MIQALSVDLDTALSEWNTTRTGPLAMPGHLKNQIIWIRLPDDAPPFSEYGFSDPSPGHNSSHIEIYTVQISTSTPQNNALVPAPPIPNCQYLVLQRHATKMNEL